MLGAMRRHLTGRLVAGCMVEIGLLLLTGCAPSGASNAPAESPAPASDAPTSKNDPHAAQPAPEPAASEGDEWADDEPIPSVSAEDPGPQNALSLCESICKKMDGACADRAADFCRASCGDYESAARKCPVEVEAALGCQTSADDFLLCSNIAAPSCAPLFKRMQDCRDGAMAPQARGAQPTNEDETPAGFSLLAVPSLGVQQLLPSTARLGKSKEGLALATASLDNVHYALIQLPDEPKTPTDKSILLTATTFVGNDCQPKLRLRGRFETQDTIHVRFDTVCKDGKQHHGMLHFMGAQVVVTVATSDAGVDAPPEDVLDAFLFSFKKA